jgi:diaminohydroxyphosphoribosylaminopyrimidine deaminase/5-amino-6-(5-phosphoribosylamino)uracil reductase
VVEDALMQRALVLAARGRGRTSPNPMVGATVITADGVIVGDGWHQQAGTPHAEVHALAAAGSRARGATLVCTLEPCCHYGRTGPCTDAIIAAGISRVIVAAVDPNPEVAGQGVARLRARGIDVVQGVRAREAAVLNRAFFMAMRESRPWVIMKAGASADGRVAAAAGRRTSITSPASRRHAHRLRAEVDAVAVGSETLLVDDPELTVREVFRPRPLTRVIFDRRLRTPASARIFQTLALGPVCVVTTEESRVGAPARGMALESAGATLEATSGTIRDAVRFLDRTGVRSLLVEGGPQLHAAFWEAGMLDEVQVYVAPGVHLPQGVPLVSGGGPMLAALHDVIVEPVGDDVLVRGYVHRPH